MDYKQNNTTAEEKQDLPGWYYNHSKIIIIYNCNKLINNNSVENMIKWIVWKTTPVVRACTLFTADDQCTLELS